MGGTNKYCFRSIGIIGFCVLVLVSSCKKPPGPGGKATIEGKVFAKYYDGYGYAVISQSYKAGEPVYICYGTNSIASKKVNTSYDGSFSFLYLNKGHYKIFVNSRDTSIHVKGSKKTIPVAIELDITTTHQTDDIGDIIINK